MDLEVVRRLSVIGDRHGRVIHAGSHFELRLLALGDRQRKSVLPEVGSGEVRRVSQCSTQAMLVWCSVLHGLRRGHCQVAGYTDRIRLPNQGRNGLSPSQGQLTLRPVFGGLYCVCHREAGRTAQSAPASHGCEPCSRRGSEGGTRGRYSATYKSHSRPSCGALRAGRGEDTGLSPVSRPPANMYRANLFTRRASPARCTRPLWLALLAADKGVDLGLANPLLAWPTGREAGGVYWTWSNVQCG